MQNRCAPALYNGMRDCQEVLLIPPYGAIRSSYSTSSAGMVLFAAGILPIEFGRTWRG